MQTSARQVADPTREVFFERGDAWLLANPRAGRGRAAVALQSVRRRLRHDGWRVNWATDHPAVAPPPPHRPEVVVVIGGDGTLRAAVERTMALYPDHVPPVLPVPMGTANLMGQYLGVPRPLTTIAVEGVLQGLRGFMPPRADRLLRWREARTTATRVSAALARGEAVQTDVGRVGDHVFLLMAGVGFDAHVVRVLDERRAGPVGLLSYAVPAASAVAGYPFPPLRVDVDGRRLWGPRPGIVMIANVPQYGTGFPIVPGARADDGLLDVLCLPCRNRSEMLKLFALTATGQHIARGVSATCRSAEVTAEAVEDVPVQVDGDPGGTLPLRAQVLPAAIPLVAPG